jgi:antagonist of KipI
MSLTVLAPGLFTLPVGLGQTGRRALGLPLGGAADRGSLMLGNGLVGNPPDAAGLELTLSGPTLRAERPMTAVVFGAAFDLTRNGRPIEPGVTFHLDAGDVLRIGGAAVGCRAYLCVAGGFDLPKVPEPVRAGDVLRCGDGTAAAGRSIALPLSTLERGSGGEVFHLRVLPGPQRDWFPDDSFFARPYTVSSNSNRMGVRLLGEPIPRRAGELVSEPVAPGAVQVTNDGLPVVLGVDGQTIGGYPKVAHVIRADLDKLGQLRPGERVRFVPMTPEEADAAGAEHVARIRNLLLRLQVMNPATVSGGEKK